MKQSIERNVYVIGTGISLLDLSAEERQFVADSGKVLSINRFYLHHEKIDIFPTSVIVADFNYYADLILRNVIDKRRDDGTGLTVYANANYHRMYSQKLRDWPFRAKARRMLKRRYGYAPTNRLPGIEDTYPIEVANESPVFAWARSLHEPMYHRRGSLPTALNLANIIYPEHNAVLLGIDLSTPKYFYDELITPATSDRWVDEKYTSSVDAGIHANARPKKHDGETMIDAMRNVVREFNAQGLSITNANPNSMLVTEGVTAWQSIL